MAHSIKLSDSLVSKAQTYASVYNRSVPKQIEYWSMIGQIAEDNPDLTYSFIEDILLSKAAADNGEVSEYEFG